MGVALTPGETDVDTRQDKKLRKARNQMNMENLPHDRLLGCVLRRANGKATACMAEGNSHGGGPVARLCLEFETSRRRGEGFVHKFTVHAPGDSTRAACADRTHKREARA